MFQPGEVPAGTLPIPWRQRPLAHMEAKSRISTTTPSIFIHHAIILISGHQELPAYPVTATIPRACEIFSPDTQQRNTEIGTAAPFRFPRLAKLSITGAYPHSWRGEASEVARGHSSFSPKQRMHLKIWDMPQFPHPAAQSPSAVLRYL